MEEVLRFKAKSFVESHFVVQNKNIAYQTTILVGYFSNSIFSDMDVLIHRSRLLGDIAYLVIIVSMICKMTVINIMKTEPTFCLNLLQLSETRLDTHVQCHIKTWEWTTIMFWRSLVKVPLVKFTKVVESTLDRYAFHYLEYKCFLKTVSWFIVFVTLFTTCFDYIESDVYIIIH